MPDTDMSQGVQEFLELLKKQQDFDQWVVTLSPNELAKLPDDQLLCALQARIEAAINQETPTQPAVSALAFHILCLFDMEVQNGGLCQFFVNYPHAAPYVVSAFREVGAQAYGVLYEVFCTKNAIDPENLAEFDIDEKEEYEALCKKYSFSDFDDAYYALYESDPLEKHVIPYVRARLEDF